MTRRATIKRKTNETAIELTLALDGTGQRTIATPVPFFNHMLEAFARHGLFDLEVDATGDVEVDAHHTGRGRRHLPGAGVSRGARRPQRHRPLRRGDVPMDETLVSAAVDFCGRAAFVYLADALKGKMVGTFDAELGREFFGGFVVDGALQPAPEVRYGENAHHMIEALFKAFARATSAAARLDPRVVGVPSTKGTLTT